MLCAALLAIPEVAHAHPAWGIVVVEGGTVFFTDVNTNSVWKRTSDGRLSRLASGIHSHPLWFDRDRGWLYGEHVWWIASENRFDRYWWRLSLRGGFERVPSLPEGLEWMTDSHGSRYRADGVRIHQMSRDGVSSVVGGDPFGGFPEVPGTVNSIAVAPDGSLYVADSARRCVWQIRPSEQPRRAYTPDGLWTPTGVALSGPELYVLEDRPNGPAVLLDYWEGPRLIRVAEGRAELVVVVDEYREEVVLGVLGATLLVALGVVGVWKWRHRPRRPQREPRDS